MRLPVACVLLVCLAVAIAGCDRDAPPVPEFDGQAALGYVERQLAFGPRVPGTPGHRQMGDWLDSLLRARADTVLVQSWAHVSRQGDTLELRNFIARFNPAATERILFLAHWDTRPHADGAGTIDSTAPVPGANDGASGVAVLLGMADRLDSVPPDVGVDLLFVDGEDYGVFAEETDVLLGSRHYAANLPPGPMPTYAVLVDMVGDRDLQLYQEGNSVVGAPAVVERVWETAREMGYEHYFISRVGHTVTDDHLPLQQVGIPAIDVIDFDYGTDNRYWHTTEDTIDKVSARSLEVVGNVMMALVRQAGT